MIKLNSSLIYRLFLALVLVVAFQNVALANSEEDRNRKISNQCQSYASGYSDGNGQTTPLCQQAMYYRCLANELGSYYPSEEGKLNGNADKVCNILSNMGASCPACN